MRLKFYLKKHIFHTYTIRIFTHSKYFLSSIHSNYLYYPEHVYIPDSIDMKSTETLNMILEISSTKVKLERILQKFVVK